MDGLLLTIRYWLPQGLGGRYHSPQTVISCVVGESNAAKMGEMLTSNSVMNSQHMCPVRMAIL